LTPEVPLLSSVRVWPELTVFSEVKIVAFWVWLLAVMPNKEKRRKKAANRRKKEDEESKAISNLLISNYLEQVSQFFNSIFVTNIFQRIFIQIIGI
jgi:hypothetical protein